MLYAIIVFSLALIPFLTLSIGDGIRTPKEIASILALISITGICQFYKRQPFTNKWIILFWAWCFVTTISSINIPQTLGWDGTTIHFFQMQLPNGRMLGFPLVLFAWKEIFYISISIFTIISLSSVDFEQQRFNLYGSTILLKPHDNQSLTRGISNIINWCVIIMCVYAFIQALGFDDFFQAISYSGYQAVGKIDPNISFSHRIVGTIGNPSLFAVWLAICLPFSLYLRNIKGYIGFTLNSIVIVFLTWSITAIIAGIISVLFYFFFTRRKIFWKLIIILIIAGTVTILTPTLRHKAKISINPTGRIECHKETWKILKNNPLRGIGLGSFEYVVGLNPTIVQRLKNQNWRQLHDEYGQIWFSVGLIGLGLFISFCISVFISFIKHISVESAVFASSLIGFLVICLTHFPMRVAPISYYGIILTGLLMNTIRRNG